MHKVLFVLAVALVFMAPRKASAQGWGDGGQPSFSETIRRVVSMPNDTNLQSRASRAGLRVVNLMWEDTARSPGSSVGPNISDLTLQVREPLRGGGIRTHLLPVIRHPNFSDRSADVPAREIWVRVGNHRPGSALVNLPLSEVLGHLGSYLSSPDSLLGDGDFRAPRDTHYLVSAQHVFVPIQSRGQAEFNPVLYNYQSQPGSPAVLTLLVSRQGTSATIIENRSGDQSLQGWGQQLFFNHEGQRTTFSAERRSAVEARLERGEGGAEDSGGLDEGADMMMLIQVPLRHRRRRGSTSNSDIDDLLAGALGGSSGSSCPRCSASGVSNVEQAVISHGADQGPFRELGGLRLVRDPRFPVRVTVQFYRATSNGVVSEADLASVHRQIERVYEDADFVGSLVVPRTERTRPTDWIRARRHSRQHP